MNGSGVSIACPHCGEPIKAAAKLCKHCRRPVEGAALGVAGVTNSGTMVASPPMMTSSATLAPPEAVVAHPALRSSARGGAPTALMLFGAFCFVWAAFSKEWFSLADRVERRDAPVRVGLAAWSACNENGCDDGTLEATSHLGVLDLLRDGEAHRAWVDAGAAAQWTHVVAGLVVLVCLALRHNPPASRKVIVVFLSAIPMVLYAFLCGSAFVFDKPEVFRGLSPSWAWFGSAVGTVSAAVGVMLVVREVLEEARAPSLFGHLEAVFRRADVSRGTATPSAVLACPRCHAPTVWRPEHGMFYCARCVIYVDQRSS